MTRKRQPGKMWGKRVSSCGNSMCKGPEVPGGVAVVGAEGHEIGQRVLRPGKTTWGCYMDGQWLEADQVPGCDCPESSGPKESTRRGKAGVPRARAPIPAPAQGGPSLRHWGSGGGWCVCVCMATFKSRPVQLVLCDLG